MLGRYNAKRGGLQASDTAYNNANNNWSSAYMDGGTDAQYHDFPQRTSLHYERYKNMDKQGKPIEQI